MSAFGGFASTGAIARTATNIRNGATSPLAGIVHALTLVLGVVYWTISRHLINKAGLTRTSGETGAVTLNWFFSLAAPDNDPLSGKINVSGTSGTISGSLLGFGLLHLLRIEIQSHLFGQDRLPGQILARRLVEILQPGLVRGQKHQRESSLRVLVAANLPQPKRVAVEPERLGDVGHADHGVQVFHRLSRQRTPGGRHLAC